MSWKKGCLRLGTNGRVEYPVKKIFFVIQSLAGGGAQRALILIAENLDRSRFKPIIVIFDDIMTFELRPDMPLVCLYRTKKSDFFRIIFNFAKLIKEEKPYAIVSFLEYSNFITVLASFICRPMARIILVVQNVTSMVLAEEYLSWLKRWLVRLLYPFAKKIIAVSQTCAEDLAERFGIPMRLIEVIPNPTSLPMVEILSRESPGHPWFDQKRVPVIISVGRLTRQKGYFYLLRAFSRVLKVHPCRLMILGEGEDRDKLEKLSEELELSGNFEILNFQKNPFKFMARSDIFVLPSLYEGMPLALLEAMACGTAVIATRGLSGLERIIIDKENGLLVTPGDEGELANAIRLLLADSVLRDKVSKSGKIASEKYAADKIARRYERLFNV